MIWQYGATVTYANDELISLNKFVSWISDDFYNLFYYYCPNTSMWHPDVLYFLDLNTTLHLWF